MADQPPPGWWQASDGQWYPPEAKPGEPMPAPAAPPSAPPSLDKGPGGFAAPGSGEPPVGGPPGGFGGPPVGAPVGAPGAPGYGAPGFGAPGGAAPYGGAPGYGAAPYGGGSGFPTGPKTSGLAIAAIVLGGGALAISLIPVLGWFSVPFALAGIVVGVIALGKLGKGGPVPEKGRGLAIAGVVTGVLAILMSIFWFFVIDRAADEIPNLDTDGGINTDPSDGTCDPERFLQDPDC